MSNEIFPSDRIYKFLKVEEYFEYYKEWQKIEQVVGHFFNQEKKSLGLEFDKGDGSRCLMLVQVPQNDTLRIRFNPTKSKEEEYQGLTRLVEMGEFDQTDHELKVNQLFDISYKEENGKVFLTTKSQYNSIVMEVVVTLNPFDIKVYNYSDSNSNYSAIPVWQTEEPGIYYTPHGAEDYAIIQAVKKPPSAKYIGFGEQGGTKLSKNMDQLNYFNFDNMRYRQVYNRGPLDNREPLYHSEPFFYEFYGVPGSNNVNAVLLDNPSQVFIDIGYSNSTHYLLGTRFGDLDYYLFLGEDPKNILDSFTGIVGRAALKPRYILGYHQGCYGYEHRSDLEWVVRKYREYDIPLDGLAVDVDVQDNYRTFTINTNNFPDPEGMFSWLRSQGVKCSTNITPVISKQDQDNPEYYSTYKEALENGYFVMDNRYDADNPESKEYQLYGSGREFRPNEYRWSDPEGFNSGQPYIGEVYYGNDASGKELGTPGHYADLGRPEVREWWGKQYQYLYEMGLEFVWQDMTTPAIRDFRGDMKGFPFQLLVTSDFQLGKQEQQPALKVWNLYSYNLHKATYEGLNKLHELSDKLKWRENKRNFIIGRGSYVGSHRFAGLWTGDNSSDWDFLQMNISQILSLGLHGLAVTGQDIGGFEESIYDGGKWADPELLIRWTAAGAFLPWFRNHYVRKGRKYFQEPFMYIEWFGQYRNGNIPEPQELYYMVLPICKHYIQLRYRLMQLFYDALFENTLDGVPICRPLFLNDPQDQSLYNDKDEFLNNEFFVRKDFLVAPVLHPEYENNNGGKRDVYLPQGSNWYCFVDNTMPLGSTYEGGTTVREFDANLNLNGSHIHFIVPIFVRAGAIIPTIEVEQYVGQLNAEGKPNPITLNVYPGDCLFAPKALPIPVFPESYPREPL
ncbi:MAG: alpha-glucosidase, partial [Okeania sp. SIO3B3]|nr:alpha-glucosidase [Okeania sp. SIO3B3]